jgi:hypothetical protein
MTVAEYVDPAVAAPPAPERTIVHESVGPACCAECFRLRGDYIRRLAEFNEAAARHQAVVCASMDGPATRSSWRAFQNACVVSRVAWAVYRGHVAGVAGSHAPGPLPTAA